MDNSKDQDSKQEKEILQNPELSLIEKNPFSDMSKMKISCSFLS